MFIENYIEDDDYTDCCLEIKIYYDGKLNSDYLEIDMYPDCIIIKDVDRDKKVNWLIRWREWIKLNIKG